MYVLRELYIFLEMISNSKCNGVKVISNSNRSIYVAVVLILVMRMLYGLVMILKGIDNGNVIWFYNYIIEPSLNTTTNIQF